VSKRVEDIIDHIVGDSVIGNVFTFRIHVADGRECGCDAGCIEEDSGAGDCVAAEKGDAEEELGDEATGYC